MEYLFKGCSSLKDIDLSNFNTNNVKDMNSMFQECSSLKELNLSNFNTNNVKDMNSMFQECSSLENLNISNFYFSNDNNTISMFYNCSDDFKKKIKGKLIFLSEDAFEKESSNAPRDTSRFFMDSMFYNEII